MAAPRVGFQAQQEKQIDEGTLVDAGKTGIENEGVRSLLQSYPFPTLICDCGTLSILMANEAASLKYGYSVDEFLELTLYDIHPSPLWAALAEFMSRPGNVRKDVWLQRKKQGGLFDVELLAKDLVLEGNRAKLVVVYDVTERVNREKTLEAALEHVRLDKMRSDAVIAAIGDGISIQDRDFRIIYQNEKHREMVGDLRGKYCYTVHLHSNDSENGCPVAVSFATGCPATAERTLHTADGPTACEMTASPLRNAEGEIIAGIEVCRDISSRKRWEKALRESERKLTSLLAALPGMAYRSRNDSDRTMEFVSEGCLDLTGYPGDALVKNREMTYGALIHPGDRDAARERIRDAVHENRIYELNYRIITANGTIRWVWEKGSGVCSPEGNVIALEGFICDVTEHKTLEAKLVHAQKMEAVGELSGGVAHEFNNIVNVIMGFASLMEPAIDKESAAFHYLQQIVTAAERAAVLTGSLLAFSRKNPMKLQPVNLIEVLGRIRKLLKVLIRENIELEVGNRDTELWVMADTGQLEQVLVNLATNAADAMPAGGRITVSVDATMIDDDYLQAHGVGEPGIYAQLTFSDTGHGMDEKTRQKVFHPFFSTKEVGKGTGLGLSIIYGIIQQHRGFISCHSEIGRGTTFTIYLPLVNAIPGEIEAVPREAPILSGHETLLLAEDDPQLRNLVKTLLEDQGYSIIEAFDGDDAITKFRQNHDAIALSIVDVIMPKKNGREVYEEITRIKAGSKILFTSGYPRDVFEKTYILQENLDFMAKPFVAAELLEKIRHVLDR